MLSSTYVTSIVTLPVPLTAGATINTNNSNFRRYGTLYVGNIEYKLGTNGSINIMRIHNPEGFAASTGTLYYYRKDHLGNNREVWTQTYGTNQTSQYYPSGLPWETNSGDNPDFQPYKYGGKEFVEMHGLDEYDSQARWCYPAIMRTTTMDPLAEKYYDISPYAWCGNNPVNFVDPDGRVIVDSKGNSIYSNGQWAGNQTGARRIGESMMATPVGKDLFNQMVNSDIKVELILDSGIGGGEKNGTIKIDHINNTAKITIFEGMAENKLAELKASKKTIDLGGTLSTASESDKARLDNMPISVDEIIGQKGVHEAVHLLDKGSQGKYEPDANKREVVPVKKEIEAIKQTPQYRFRISQP